MKEGGGVNLKDGNFIYLSKVYIYYQRNWVAR